MLAGTHILVGAAIYRLAENKPGWVKVPAVLFGGFASHYLLDSVASYHRLGDNWYDLALTGVQIAAVTITWLTGALEAKGWQIFAPPMLLSGLWAWLSWDWERVFRLTWLHLDSCKTWAPRFFSECSSNPWTALWEVGLVVGLASLLWRYNAPK